MNVKSETSGRAKIALVFGRKGNRQGLLSTVTAQVRGYKKKGSPLVFKGPVKFAEATVAHITGVILPIIDRICTALHAAPKTFELCVANFGATACHDLGVEVSGLSADLPIMLTMLSAALKLPLRDDFVATGHIASVVGDVVAVEGIPAKLAAAIDTRTVKRFIYGDLSNDRSLDVLSPQEKDAAVAAIMKACNTIEAKAVAGLDELLAEAFTEHAIVSSSLRNGFFHIPPPAEQAGDPVARAIAFLAGHNDVRFWQLLQRDFSTGEFERGLHLLEIYAVSFADKGQYPSHFGSRLLRLLCALPPAIRRLKLKYPLLNFGHCIELARLAGPSDFVDVPVLFDAVRGRVPGDDRWAGGQEDRVTSTVADCDLFDTITAEIRELALVRKFDAPIDSARASFVLAASTVRSYDEFLGIIESFFTHLLSYAHPETAAEADLDRAKDGATSLLARAFCNHGSLPGAFARAQTGIDGGMRSVLDAMTDRYRVERRAEYIETFLSKAFTGMDPAEQVRFARGALERLWPMLSEELRREPPERFVNRIDEVVRVYASSMAGIERMLKTM